MIHKEFIPLVEEFRRVEEAGGHLLLGHTVHEQRYPALQATGIRRAVKDSEIEVRNLIGKVLRRNADAMSNLLARSLPAVKQASPVGQARCIRIAVQLRSIECFDVVRIGIALLRERRSERQSQGQGAAGWNIGEVQVRDVGPRICRYLVAVAPRCIDEHTSVEEFPDGVGAWADDGKLEVAMRIGDRCRVRWFKHAGAVEVEETRYPEDATLRGV